MSSVQLLPNALSELYVHATITGKLTMADRYGLMAAILEESISEEEAQSLNRLLHALYRGQLKIVNELSIIL